MRIKVPPIWTAGTHCMTLAVSECSEGMVHIGKTPFAQIMDFLPWKTFHRIVTRYRGDHRVRTLSCVEQLRCMAFAQLTYRVSRSPLADANVRRD